MKFPGENGAMATIHGKSSDARRSYQESLKITKEKQKMERRDLKRDAGVMMTN
jgi:hypothetical protein